MSTHLDTRAVLDHALGNPAVYAAAVAEVRTAVARHFGAHRLEAAADDLNDPLWELSTSLLCLDVMNGDPAGDAERVREAVLPALEALAWDDRPPLRRAAALTHLIEAMAGLALERLDPAGSGHLRAADPVTADDAARSLARATLAGDREAGRVLVDRFFELDSRNREGVSP